MQRPGKNPDKAQQGLCQQRPLQALWVIVACFFPLLNSPPSASPDLWGSVLRVRLLEVSQCLHDSRGAFHVGVVDHDVTCQQDKNISATVPLPGSSPRHATNLSQRPMAHVAHRKTRGKNSPFTLGRMTGPMQLPLPNTSEGFSNSSK